MKCLLVLSVLLASAYSLPVHLDSNTTSYSEKECGSSFEKLWLEVVFVVDNSKGMTNEGLAKVVASMKSTLQEATIGIRTYPQTTRVGLVTYNKHATTVYGLNAFNSYNEFASQVSSTLRKVSDVSESNLAAGLYESSHVFTNSHLENRKQYQRVVIAYTNTYQEGHGLSLEKKNPLRQANDLKAKGIQIITVAVEDTEGELNGLLQTLATPDYFFETLDSQLTADIKKALLTINCFCPSGWMQYEDIYGNDESKKYGLCVYQGTEQLTWIEAKKACMVNNNGYLLNERSSAKHDFTYKMFKYHEEIPHPTRYHIGLSYYNNAWRWEQPHGLNGQPATFTYWNPGFPVADSSKLGVMNVEATDSAGWQNVNLGSDKAYFACEVAACDTDNFCESTVA